MYETLFLFILYYLLWDWQKKFVFHFDLIKILYKKRKREILLLCVGESTQSNNITNHHFQVAYVWRMFEKISIFFARRGASYKRCCKLQAFFSSLHINFYLVKGVNFYKFVTIFRLTFTNSIITHECMGNIKGFLIICNI